MIRFGAWLISIPALMLTGCSQPEVLPTAEEWRAEREKLRETTSPVIVARASAADQRESDGWLPIESMPGGGISRWGTLPKSTLRFQGSAHEGRHVLTVAGRREPFPTTTQAIALTIRGEDRSRFIEAGPGDFISSVSIRLRDDHEQLTADLRHVGWRWSDVSEADRYSSITEPRASDSTWRTFQLTSATLAKIIEPATP